jgi:hypothetical protein
MTLNPKARAKAAQENAEQNAAAGAMTPAAQPGSEMIHANEAQNSDMSNYQDVVSRARGISEDPTIHYPRLQLAYGVGDLANAGFAPGTCVIDGEFTLLAPTARTEMLFTVEPKTTWKEEIPGQYNPDVMPRRFATLDEAHAENLSEKWDNATNTKPTVNKSLNMTILVKKSAGAPVHTADIDLGEHGVWLPCVYDADKSAHNNIVSTVSQAFLGKCKRNPLALTFEFFITRKQFSSGNTTPVPNVKTLRMTEPALIAALQNALGIDTGAGTGA